MDESSSSATPASAASARIPQFAIPPLQPGQRIDDWEPLFKAAVTGLMLHENGQSLAISLLPAYLTRRSAEIELAKEVIQLTNLDEAFELLRTLDAPIDKFDEMQKLCRADWLPGIQIDDFYYSLRQQAKRSGAGNDLVMSVLIAQLPKSIQSRTKVELSERKGTDAVLSDSGARRVIPKIK